MNKEFESDYDLGEEVVTREVTTREFDDAIAQLISARADYDQKKKIASEANETVESLETKLMELLKLAGKSSYKADGLGTITLVNKYSVRVPQTGDDKDALFAWIEAKYGKEGLDKYRTVNSMALNSLYNQVIEEGIAELPGVGMPSARPQLQLRMGRK